MPPRTLIVKYQRPGPAWQHREGESSAHRLGEEERDKDGDPPLGRGGGGGGGFQGAAWGENHILSEHAQIKHRPLLNTDAWTRCSDYATGTWRDTWNKLPNCSSASLVSPPGFAPGPSASWRSICRHMSASRLRAAPAFPGEAAWAACVCRGRGIPLQGKHGAGARVGNRALQN